MTRQRNQGNPKFSFLVDSPEHNDQIKVEREYYKWKLKQEKLRLNQPSPSGVAPPWRKTKFDQPPESVITRINVFKRTHLVPDLTFRVCFKVPNADVTATSNAVQRSKRFHEGPLSSPSVPYSNPGRLTNWLINVICQ